MSSHSSDAKARTLAVELLSAAEESDKFIDHLLETSPAAARLETRDRALLQELAYGVLRNQTYLDLILMHYLLRGYHHLPVRIKNIFRVAMYQLVFLERIPDYAVVSEAVQLSRERFGQKRSGLVNAVLRNYLREPYRPPEPDPNDAAALAGFYSHPLWLVRRFIEQFGQKETIAWLQANNRQPAIYLLDLDNSLPNDPENPLQPVPELLEYAVLPQGMRPEQVPGWQEGRFIVQDPSAGLVIRLLDPQPGERMIDLCAAPGGKTLACRAKIGATGQVVAVDRSKLRLQKLHENLRRIGYANVEIVEADARTVELEPADAVLVDAPCSGLGVLARRADLRWRRRQGDLKKLLPLQREILQHAATLVKPGGCLVYSTCSIEFQENEQIVEWFQQANPEFTLERAQKFVHERFCSEEGYLRTFPHRHGFDGGFGARFKKKPE